jgi:hypothetical protein
VEKPEDMQKPTATLCSAIKMMLRNHICISLKHLKIHVTIIPQENVVNGVQGSNVKAVNYPTLW